MASVKIIFSDFNGTLVHQHTMSDMLRVYFDSARYAKAHEAFTKQADGLLSIKEAFDIAGPLTAGLTLRNAIDYVLTHLTFIDGFGDLLGFLKSRSIPLVIISTGYSVTMYAVEAMLPVGSIAAHFSNRLLFAPNEVAAKTIVEDELRRMTNRYVTVPDARTDAVFDNNKATGQVELAIPEENTKTELVNTFVAKNFPSIRPEEIAFIGDSMGDAAAIVTTAKAGGFGIAFNYNSRLETFLKGQAKPSGPSDRITLIEPKSQSTTMQLLIAALKEFAV